MTIVNNPFIVGEGYLSPIISVTMKRILLF